LPLRPGEHAWQSLPPSGPWPESELPSDLSECQQLLYTSGTTGNPKAIVGTHAKFAIQGRRLVEHFGVRPSDRMYTGLSLTHANALLISLAGSLYSGIPLVISRRFTQSRLWGIIRRHECTTLNLLGGMFTHIFAMPPTDGDADNPLRMVISAGMPLAIWSDFSRRFGVEITEFYGSAEGGSTVNRCSEGPMGSCGRPARGLEMAILDDQDQPCPPGVPGEIVFRNLDGSPMTVTYFGNPEASAAKTRGGWLRMGDMGHVDQDGWLFFMHRKGHGIRRNGEFIATAYIEKEIAKYPGVADVFIYGVDSGNAGEKDIVAALVLDDADAFQPERLMHMLSKTLERSHLPSYLHLTGSIPKTASEKPLERILQQEFASGQATILPCAPGTAG
jgi:crotonobetaine/carnitine-CoA ligase